MLRTWSRKLGLFVVLLLAVFTVTVNRIGHAEKSIWTVNNQNRAAIVLDKSAARATFPTEFKLFDLNFEPLKAQLFTIVGDNARQRSTVITLPNADGNMEQFEVYEASNFEPELQAQFPEIRAYSGKGVTDRYATLKLSISPQGIQTMVFRADNYNEFIEPYSQDHATYAVFRGLREKGSLPWECSTEDRAAVLDAHAKAAAASPESNTGQLKTMRLAQSCNGEYSNFFGATSSAQVANVLTAFNNTIARVNGVLEKDLAIHLNLIANTTAVIFYDPGTDPYTNLSSWNAQLQATLTANIGEANYDIGHMFGASGGGGNAGCIGCVCTDNIKGSGITSPADGIPMGDNFDIDYVVHEMGHQLGANHSFSHTSEAGSTVQKEVGSGITIMGYAGITSRDVAPHSIDTFHSANISQIQSNMAGKTCPVTTVMTVNHPPVVSPGVLYTIPISTPFALTGSATDPENDPLTYQWEQNDNATTFAANSIASPTKTTGPNFLSFLPTSSPTRYFPRLSTVQSGLFVTPVLPGGDAGTNIEALSSVARQLNFRLTVRDNRPFIAASSTGQTQFSDYVVDVVATAGPFKVTAPNTAVSWAGNSSQTVTWDVAGTTGNGVNVANVKISLSTDGGNTFPTVISASTPNDGTENITVPNSASTTARIKVEAVGNVFYDMGDVNFTITAGPITNRPVFDFDGDGKSDDAVTRDVAGSLTWYILRSTTGFTGVSWGTTSTDISVPGDYDGDGKWDTAVFRSGTFHILQSSNGLYVAIPFGSAGDDPRITADFDGDGKTDPAVTRNVGGVLTFFVQRSTAGPYGASFGTAATDVGVRGDFDGDNKADVAVYRKDTGSPANTFFVIRSSDGVVIGTTFGNYTLDYPVPGDFDGDSKTDFAVFRGRAGGDGFWYYLRSSNGAFVGQPFGAAGDQPVPGDYDADGKTDPAVWRPGAPGAFYHLNSATSSVTGVAFGTTGDTAPSFALQAK